MSASMICDASITLPLLGTANDAASIAANPDLAELLRAAIERFSSAVGVR